MTRTDVGGVIRPAACPRDSAVGARRSEWLGALGWSRFRRFGQPLCARRQGLSTGIYTTYCGHKFSHTQHTGNRPSRSEPVPRAAVTADGVSRGASLQVGCAAGATWRARTSGRITDSRASPTATAENEARGQPGPPRFRLVSPVARQVRCSGTQRTCPPKLGEWNAASRAKEEGAGDRVRPVSRGVLRVSGGVCSRRSGVPS